MTHRMNKEYYDRVYLCIEKNNQFECKKFETFESADNYFHDNHNPNVEKSTLIPLCKYVPNVFDKLILERKLRPSPTKGNVEKTI